MAEKAIHPHEALKLLQQGNARYMAGGFDRPHQDQFRRVRTSQDGQRPFATILACSDSRVPVELIFDRGIGDIFVIRVAGNVMGIGEMSSVEYAIELLRSPLFVVMGHSHCGAVKAVVEKGILPGNLRVLSERILPAVEQARTSSEHLRGEQFLTEAVKTNVWQTIEHVLRLSAPIRERCLSGSLMVIGAFYDIEAGSVQWLGSHPSESELLQP